METKGSRIAVFDSGVGGLNVLSELQKLLPKMEYVYCLDNAFYPYGTKSDAELLHHLTHLIPRIVQRYFPNILVVACNTASTVALDAIRNLLAIPVVGVVPAIKPAAQLSKTRVLGLLATEATVRTKYTDQLISDFASDCELIKVGSRKLVDLAEAKVRGEKPSLQAIFKELEPFFLDPRVDTVILACTHFDHLREEFESIAPRAFHWLSSSSAVALRTKTLAETLHLAEIENPSNVLVSTLPCNFSKSLMKEYSFHSIDTLSMA